MNTAKVLRVGSRVKYIHKDSKEDKELGYYPPIGTYGTVTEVSDDDIRVKWDKGTINGDWFCDYTDVEIIGDFEKLNLAIDWNALSESEQITLHELLSKAHSAAIKEISE